MSKVSFDLKCYQVKRGLSSLRVYAYSTTHALNLLQRANREMTLHAFVKTKVENKAVGKSPSVLEAVGSSDEYKELKLTKGKK